MNPAIKLTNLSVAYELGKSNETLALDNISAEIFPEEFVIFFGPSGCGKSTLLNAVAGLEVPTKGNVVVNGRDINSLNQDEGIEFHRKSVGIIFQAYYLLSDLVVKDNISLPVIFSGKDVDKNKLYSLMERFGINQFSNKYPNQLSGGQQQRVAVARSLINDPPIILADEPVGNLDSKNAETVMNLISDLNKSYKKTIVLVTHNPKYLNLANRVFYMKDGKVIRVVGSTKGAKSSNSVSTELDQLSFIFPYLNIPQLKAKLILNHLFMPGDFDIQERIENSIYKFIQGNITYTQLDKFLDESRLKGGVGFYKQTAVRITDEIKALVNEIKSFEKGIKEEDTKKSEDKVVSLRRYILDKFSQLKLNADQIAELDKLLYNRVDKKITNKELFASLNKSNKKGGLGINRRTANKIIDEMKIITK